MGAVFAGLPAATTPGVLSAATSGDGHSLQCWRAAPPAIQYCWTKLRLWWLSKLLQMDAGEATSSAAVCCHCRFITSGRLLCKGVKAVRRCHSLLCTVTGKTAQQEGRCRTESCGCVADMTYKKDVKHLFSLPAGFWAVLACMGSMMCSRQGCPFTPGAAGLTYGLVRVETASVHCRLPKLTGSLPAGA